MKIGITCGGIGPYASGSFIRASAIAAEAAGFAHYWMPDHVVQLASYPESVYPYAAGSGQEVPEQSDGAPLKWDDHTYSNQDAANPLIDTARQGAVPLTVGSEVVGVFAVSGAPGGDKDEVCVRAGMAKIADRLK